MTTFSTVFTKFGHAVEKTAFQRKQLNADIFRIDSPLNPFDPYLVFTHQEGRVYKVSSTNHSTLETLNIAAQEKRSVTFQFDSSQSDYILTAKLNEINENSPASLPFENDQFSNSDIQLQNNFEPTYLNSNDELLRLFQSVYSYPYSQTGETDCFNRAQYWARTYQLQYNVNSQKIFIFFTSKYIREHNYKWWYHVAPLMLVKAWPWGGTEYVMDSTFINTPVSIDRWSRFFAQHASRGCSWGNSIRDYESRKESEDCVLVKAPMYYYFPRDLEPNYNLRGWRCWDMSNTQKGLPAPYLGTWDEKFIPNGCPRPE